MSPQSSESVGSRHDRRRRQTHDQIADVALDLFSRRGYENVTIAEIAEAADVAKQTVVNHYPAKEDLLLAWHRPVEADVVDLIAEVPLSTSLPTFLKQELPRMLAGLEVTRTYGETPTHTEADPRVVGDDRLIRLGQVIQRSPTLIDALRRRGVRYQDELAALLAERVPAHLGPAAAAATAAFIMTTLTALVAEAQRMRSQESTPEDIAEELATNIAQAFEILERGLSHN